MNRLREILINGIIFIALAIVTIIMIELPKKYYNSADDRLLKEIKVDRYTLNAVNEKMDLNQKVNSLTDEGTIIIEGNTDLGGGKRVEMDNALRSELYNITSWLNYGWPIRLSYISDLTYTGHYSVLQLINVIDDRTYSFDLGIFYFNNVRSGLDMDEILAGYILFDMETYKILYVYVGANYAGPIESEEAYYDGIYYDYMDDSEYYSDEYGMFYDDEICKMLDEYYGMSIPRENRDMMVGPYALILSPYTLDDITDNKTIEYISQYAYDKINQIY